jgi:NDP-sugar pyrophosphorylase family protein
VIKYFDNPVEYISNQINAGIYCIKSSLLDEPALWQRGASMEREVLPYLITEGQLHS